MFLAAYVVDQIWLCSYPVRLAGARFEARMTVIRLGSGQILVHSPCHITAAIAEEITRLGPVAHIIAPGNFHHLHITTAQAAFPTAKTWICPGVEKRSGSLQYDGVLGDMVPEDWIGEIDQVLLQGTLMREIAMFHRASHTLILVDLIENFTDATPRVGWALKFWFKYILHMWNSPCPAPEYRLGWKDRDAAKISLRRILEWDFQRIVLSHGDIIDRNAREVATAAWSGILDH